MKILKIFILLMFFVKNCFGEVYLWVEKNPVGIGEMFNLYIEASNIDNAEEPDLSKIKGLKIVSRSEQSKTSIKGNKVNRTVKWTFVVLAQYAGNYKIPSLKVGNDFTKPFLIQVIAPKEIEETEVVKLEVNISPKKVYPQQQVFIKLRIIRDGLQLVNESITPIEIKDTKIEKIKEDTYQEVKNGKKKLITEILFVAIPEKSGELYLKEINYQGDEINGVNLGSIFQKFGSYSQNKGRRIFSKSKQHSIDVLPIPGNVNGWWLPINDLKLEEKWETEEIKFMVGVPVTRSISIYVDGAYADQIPEIKTQYPNGIKKYSDKPILNTEKSSKGLKGIRIEKFALIPNKPGKIKLPEISIDWWSISEKEMKKTIIPAKIIEVMPNVLIINEEKSIREKDEELSGRKNANFKQFKDDEIFKTISFWKYVTLTIGVFWVVTLILFYRNTKYIRNLKIESEKELNNRIESIKIATKKVEKAIEQGAPEALKDQLLNWGRIYWVENPPKGLEQIGDRIPEIKNSINVLNSMLYSEKKTKYIVNELQKEFNKISFYLPKIENQNKTYLNQINPEKND